MLTVLKAGAVLFVAFLNLFLGIAVLLRNTKKPVNRIFAVLAFVFFVWSSSLFFYEFPLIINSLFWIKITYTMVASYISLVLLFSFVFPIFSSRRLRLLGIVTGVAYVTSSIWLIFFTKFWVVDVVVDAMRGKQTILGPLYNLWIGLAWLITFWAVINFFLKSRLVTGTQRIQMHYFWIGFVLFGIFVNIPDVIIPAIWNDTRYFFISAITNLFFSATMAYTILKHRFMDVRLVVARSIAYFLLIITLGFIYAAGLFLISSLFTKEVTTTSDLIASTALALLIAFTFQPVRTFWEKATNKIFYKNHYDTGEILYALTQTMASSLELSALIQNALAILREHLHISQAVVYVLDEGKIYLRESSPKKSSNFHLEKQDLEKLHKEYKLLVFEELAEDNIKEIFRQHQIAIFLPLYVKQQTVGFLVLGEKSSGNIYYEQDLMVLQIFAPEFAIALQNAQSYEEIKDFNKTLQEEIKKATLDLQQANTKLKELDQLKDEFISIASHELRSPASVAKNYLWMVLNDKNKLPTETASQLEHSYGAVERLITLINDMLDVSRIETGQIKINPTSFNLNQLVLKIKDEMSLKAQTKQIEIAVSSKNNYTVKADRDRVFQILTNLVDNAIKFTSKGGKVNINTQKMKEKIAILVSDTGIGIKDKDMPRLFTKFGRLNTSLSSVPEIPGTGLGLYISKKLTELMGGSLRVTSVFGKGSVFIVLLPGS